MKDKTILIFGHKNPDSDSICASIAYAELKRKLGYNKAIAVRLGDLNNETKYILSHFGVDRPPLIDSVRAQVSDMDFYNVPTIYPDISIGQAWKIMMESERMMLPVVDKKYNELLGVVSSGDITRANMQIDDCRMLSFFKPSIKNIVDTLKANVITGDFENNKETVVAGKIIVAMAPDDITYANPKQEDVIIARASEKCAKASLATKVKHIFLIGDCSVDLNIDFKKEANDKIIFCISNDIYNTIRLINQSIPVSSIMKTENIIYFYESDYSNDVKNAMLESKARNFPVINEDNQVIGSLSKRHIIDVEKKKVILVDHNERAQSVHGIDEADILEVVDHHNVGDIQTGKPILFRNEPVGCTSTIIANMYFENNVKLTKKIAGILLSAIISDTLMFKSPTCTLVDKMISEKLADISGINIEEFGLDMLKAGASFKGKKMKDILKSDYKEYVLANKKLFASQIFTTDLNQVFEIKDKMIELMDDICDDRGCDFGIMALTDILGTGTQLLYAGKAKEIVEKAFNAEKGSNVVFLPKVVSRKKEIIPLLSKFC